MNTLYLLLGANIGDRYQMLLKASSLIDKRIGSIVQSSKVYESEAWGYTQQNAFLNQVIKVETVMLPQACLEACLAIEQMLGRKRIEKWHERTIDIDLLFFNEDIINSNQLSIPHPFLHQRRFTLVPLAEIAANLIHPVYKTSIHEILEQCEDQLKVHAWK